jgi:hypothetical protein
MDNLSAFPATLPVDITARLPATYEAARRAIAECDRIDECKTWSDKAAALAAYARQSKDDSLRVMAVRIQARALRRCGELLKQVPRADVSTRYGQEGDHPPVVTRTGAARDAGLSEHQRKQALRVASISSEDFDYAVESQEPPTISELAEYGTQEHQAAADDVIVKIDPALAMATAELLRKFAECCESTDPIELARALPSANTRLVQQQVAVIDRWLDRLGPCLATI